MNDKSFSLPIDAGNALKFFACFLVAFSHYFTYRILGLADSEYAMQMGGICLIYKTLMSLGGALGNMIFFFLSGYGLMQSDQKKHLNCLQFVKRRLGKVYYPVLLVTALWIPISIWFHHYQYEGVLPMFKTLFWGFNDGALWFVKALILLYAIFCIFTLLYRRYEKLAHAVFLVLFAGACFYCYRRLGSFTINAMPAFYIGMLCSLYSSKIKKGIYVPLAIISLFMLVISYLLGGTARFFHAVIDYGMITVLITFFIYGGRFREFRFPAILGMLSFDVYLVHNKVLYILTENMDFCPFRLWLIVTLAIAPTFYVIRTGISRIWK